MSVADAGKHAGSIALGASCVALVVGMSVFALRRRARIEESAYSRPVSPPEYQVRHHAPIVEAFDDVLLLVAASVAPSLYLACRAIPRGPERQIVSLAAYSGISSFVGVARRGLPCLPDPGRRDKEPGHARCRRRDDANLRGIADAQRQVLATTPSPNKNNTNPAAVSGIQMSNTDATFLIHIAARLGLKLKKCSVYHCLGSPSPEKTL